MHAGQLKHHVSGEIARAPLYPPALAESLLHAMRSHPVWTFLPTLRATDPAVARANRQSLERGAPLPTQSELRVLLEAAFLGGLLEEEGRRATFTLAYVSPAAIAPTDHEALVFARPVPLRPQAIAKLAPATQPDRTFLGVYPDATGALAIWGLVHRGDRAPAIDTEMRAPFLQIRVHRPGTISVYYIGRLMLLYSRGEAHFFGDALDLAGRLQQRAHLRRNVSEALCRIARRMLAHGRGGTLLVVHAGRRPARVTLNRSFAPEAASARHLLARAMSSHEAAVTGELPHLAADQAVLHRKHLERRHEEALWFVAQLTAVDGATVVGDDLCVLGFGAQIQTGGRSDDILITVENVYTGVQRPADLAEFNGSRHRSAIHFCASQPAGHLALALVASHDGDISVFLREGEHQVTAMRSFELGIGI